MESAIQLLRGVLVAAERTTCSPRETVRGRKRMTASHSPRSGRSVLCVFSPTTVLGSKKQLWASFAPGYSLPGWVPSHPPLHQPWHNAAAFLSVGPSTAAPQKVSMWFLVSAWLPESMSDIRLHRSVCHHHPVTSTVTRAVTNKEVWVITWPFLSNHILASFFHTQLLGVGRV